MKPIVLTLSTGRCGTTFLEKTFKQSFRRGDNWVSHEYLRQEITNVGVFHRCYSAECHDQMVNDEIRNLVAKWVEVSKVGPVIDFGWTMRSLIPYLYKKIGPQLKVLYVHRHPVAVAASFKLIGSYSIYNSPQWAITPFHPRAMFPQFKDRWESMTAFEKCLYLWLEVNAFALELKERYPKLEVLEVKSEELFKSDSVLENIARFTGFYTDDMQIKKSTNKNRRDLFTLERRPIKNEWVNYERHPELVRFAEQMGYNMDREHINSFIHKYQLPKGVLPIIRNRTGYWALKENVSKAFRALGFRK